MIPANETDEIYWRAKNTLGTSPFIFLPGYRTQPRYMIDPSIEIAPPFICFIPPTTEEWIEQLHEQERESSSILLSVIETRTRSKIEKNVIKGTF